jgi:hypothetical protein
MSFAIDGDKVEELLRSSTPGYTVSSAPICPVVENHTPYYSQMGVSGTVAVDRGRALKEARGRLTAIREKIEKSGAPLQSAAELIREIDGMRGGSR